MERNEPSAWCRLRGKQALNRKVSDLEQFFFQNMSREGLSWGGWGGWGGIDLGAFQAGL